LGVLLLNFFTVGHALLLFMPDKSTSHPTNNRTNSREKGTAPFNCHPF
jgi:hypothetical protein